MVRLNLVGVPESAALILTELLMEIEESLPGLLRGFYLVGSIPLGDFYDKKSDIDFIADCNYLPRENEFELLRKIHIKINSKYPKPDLSGCYILLDSVRNRDVTNTPIVSFHEGRMKYDLFDLAPIALSEFKNCSHTIFGKLPSEFDININSSTINEFMLENINSYWRSWISDHSNLRKKWLILFFFSRFTEWGVLGVARQLYTLTTGKITSKREAGVFCLTMMPQELHSIISKAISIREDKKLYPMVGSLQFGQSLRGRRKR